MYNILGLELPLFLETNSAISLSQPGPIDAHYNNNKIRIAILFLYISCLLLVNYH